jgi:transcription initiation factor TFIIIB Brf1 subunit/transcription initiation factor TFIIB
MNDEKITCPNCDEKENFHFNYDYTQTPITIEEIVCNECGTSFEEK